MKSTAACSACRATAAALSLDTNGRLVFHSFTNILVRTSVSSRVIFEGQYGAIVGLYHLVPFSVPAPAGRSRPTSPSRSGAEEQKKPVAEVRAAVYL